MFFLIFLTCSAQRSRSKIKGKISGKRVIPLDEYNIKIKSKETEIYNYPEEKFPIQKGGSFLSLTPF